MKNWRIPDVYMEDTVKHRKAEESEVAIQDTIDNRDKIYGGFENNAAIAKELERVIEDGWQGAPPSNMQAYTLDMLCVKISRIVCGDVDHDDNWKDIEGYARILRQKQGAKS